MFVGKNTNKSLKINPINIAMPRFDNGPAAATFNVPYLESLRLYGLNGTGFAQPIKIPEDINKNMGRITVPIGSMCEIGFNVSLPAFLAVGSPNL